MLVCYEARSHSIVFRRSAFSCIHDGMTCDRAVISLPNTGSGLATFWWLRCTAPRTILHPAGSVGFNFMAYFAVMYGRCTNNEAIYRRITQQHDYVSDMKGRGRVC
jgi:hypothetical protein